jgi:hypothetical protein
VIEAAVTMIWKAGREAVALPSAALMTMLPVVPTSLLAGVPEISPLLVLMVAQPGRPVAEKAAVPPVVTTVGWNT